MLDLLASARQIVVGAATIAGPEGVRVEQTVPAGADRISRTVLRLTRNGQWVCDCRTADELGWHVDLSTLVAGPGAPQASHLPRPQLAADEPDWLRNMAVRGMTSLPVAA